MLIFLRLLIRNKLSNSEKECNAFLSTVVVNFKKTVGCFQVLHKGGYKLETRQSK